jgi:hypothetical protein
MISYTLKGMKCEDIRISEGWSAEVILVIRWKGSIEEDIPVWRNSLWEKRGCVGQELSKA